MLNKKLKIILARIMVIFFVFLCGKTILFNNKNESIFCKNIKLYASYEKDNKISDAEIINLLKNGENKKIEVIYSRYNNEKIKGENGKVYVPFIEKFNSEEKLYHYISTYYSNDMTWDFMKNIGADYVKNKYVLLLGDFGERTNWNKVKILRKKYIDDNNIEFIYDEEFKYYPISENDFKIGHIRKKGRITFEGGLWVISYDEKI